MMFRSISNSSIIKYHCIREFHRYSDLDVLSRGSNLRTLKFRLRKMKRVQDETRRLLIEIEKEKEYSKRLVEVIKGQEELLKKRHILNQKLQDELREERAWDELISMKDSELMNKDEFELIFLRKEIKDMDVKL